MLLCLLFLFVCCNAQSNLVVYWGQDPAGPWFKNTTNGNEEALEVVCMRPGYDTIIIGFVISFNDSRNGGMPDLNFAEHCETPFPNYPALLNCPQIGANITKCQEAGKKVLISMGGGVGQYGFQTTDDAVSFANLLWNMFLGNKSSAVLRPFGDAVLDGIDLDIEGGDNQKMNLYTSFLKTLRALMATDTKKKYLITGAPQCPFPDGWMGPKPGLMLGDFPSAFDFVNVQFYNNFCGFHGGADGLEKAFGQWANWSLNLAIPLRPKIVLGLPASTRASATAEDYIPPEDLQPIVANLKEKFPTVFEGVMLWDASWDQHNMIGELTYGSTIAQFLDK
jgi:chitinase